jgi:hypothetical protein
MEFKLGPPPFSGKSYSSTRSGVARVPAEMGRFGTIPLGLLIAALPLAVGGCGSGKEEVSASELTQKADAICREEQDRFDQVQAHAPANASIAADQTKELIDVSEAASSDLGDLEPPEELRDRYDAYLEARAKATDEMKKGEEAAGDQDARAYAAAQTAVAKAAPERRRLASALGFRVCGANPRSG